jgi:DNA-binding NarL/FixJ family response regulator
LVPIRILIVDDFQSWRRFVYAMLEDRPEFQIVGEASDGLEAIRKSEELQPGLILLDIGLPKLNGIEVARRICAIAPACRILFVTENRCPTIAQEALNIGSCTRGYVVKSDAAHDLLPAMEAVMQDRQFVSRRFAAADFGNREEA